FLRFGSLTLGKLGSLGACSSIGSWVGRASRSSLGQGARTAERRRVRSTRPLDRRRGEGVHRRSRPLVPAAAAPERSTLLSMDSAARLGPQIWSIAAHPGSPTPATPRICARRTEGRVGTRTFVTRITRQAAGAVASVGRERYAATTSTVDEIEDAI